MTIKGINQDKLAMLAEVGILEDKADELCRVGKDTEADMLIAATGILRECLEADGQVATVVAETSGLALLVAALSKIAGELV